MIPERTKIETFEGVDIYVDRLGKFHAKIGHLRFSRANLAALKRELARRSAKNLADPIDAVVIDYSTGNRYWALNSSSVPPVPKYVRVTGLDRSNIRGGQTLERLITESGDTVVDYKTYRYDAETYRYDAEKVTVLAGLAEQIKALIGQYNDVFDSLEPIRTDDVKRILSEQESGS